MSSKGFKAALAERSLGRVGLNPKIFFQSVLTTDVLRAI